MGLGEGDLPAVRCADASVLKKPTLRRLAGCAGLRRTCPDRIFDLAIVGAGPAGMTAGVYAASEGLSTVLIDALGPGGQAAGSSLIENFIGFPSGLSGQELATRGTLQLLKFGATLLTPVRATGLRTGPHGGEEHHELTTDGEEVVRARAVLCAAGVRWRRLEAPGARKFERAGIYYAATSVEARVCAGRAVAVVGAGNSAGQAAMFLSECSCAVHMIIRKPVLGDGMSDYLSGRIRANDRIKLHAGAEVTRVLGDETLTGVEITAAATGEKETLDCEAMFVFIGAEPHAEWLPPEAARDEDGYLLVGPDAQDAGKWPLERRPQPLETSVPRLLAAGDVRSGATKRVAFAVGDAALAVTCCHRLLHAM
jgi:thioredoxin reductase (NADPH)